MAVTVASLQAVLSLEKSDFDHGMNGVQSSVNNFSSNLMPSLKSAALLGVGAIAGLGTGAIAAGSYLIGLGSDAEEMMAKAQTVFGEGFPMAKKWFDEIAEATGRSTYKTLEWGATLQDTFVPLGFTRDAATSFATELVQLTIDMASFNNVSEDNVLADLQSALVGNHETMRKYGVIITEATLKQELLNMGIEGGIKGATEQQKVVARMNIIMAGTTDAQGDAIRTADSWANQMRALKAELHDTATTMGMELLPVVTPFLKDVLTLAKQYLPGLIDIVSKFAKELKDTLAVSIVIINDALERAGFETDAAGAAFTAFEKILGTVLTAIKLGSMAFAGWIIIAGKVRDAWQTVSNISDEIYWGLSDLFRLFKDIGSYLFGNWLGGWKTIIDTLKYFGTTLLKLPKQLPEYLQMHSPPPLAEAFTMIKDAAMGMPDLNKTLAMPPAYKMAGAMANNTNQTITQNNYYSNGESSNMSYYQLRGLAA